MPEAYIVAADRTGAGRKGGRAELNQFAGAGAIAAKYELTREPLDRFACDSHDRAAEATASGAFRAEILALPDVESAI